MAAHSKTATVSTQSAADVFLPHIALMNFEQWQNTHEIALELRVDGWELRALALHILLETDAQKKQHLMRYCSAVLAQNSSRCVLDKQYDWQSDNRMRAIPGRPALPELVEAIRTPRLSPRTPQGHAAMVHALAHIEFNAINLALDAIVRYAGLSSDYYWDWWQVAAEEAYHFWLLSQRLADLGYQYGDFAAHDGLWRMAQQTQNSFADRMAMVPRTLEARGLDACPVVQKKFMDIGDQHSVAILDIILRDEVGHVALGHRWFVWACEQQQHEPIAYYRQLCSQYHAPRIRGAMNWVARRAAGFSDGELQALTADD